MSWHLDKNVTIGVIIALIVNTGSFIWGAAEISAKIDSFDSLPNRVTTTEKKIIALETEAQLMRGIVGEIKQTMNTFNNTLTLVDKELSRRAPIANYVQNKMNLGK